MTDIGTWLKFLIGDREAITRIARDRAALWIGAMFVLSAGFAREYDGEDLLHEPWHLLIPFAASVAISAVLFTPFWLRIERPQRPRFGEGYRAFLALFWLIAPMAWLYAIPYERMLSAPSSVRANLWTLALVSVWRVGLISRVLSVLTGQSIAVTLTVVLMIADAAVQAALSVVPLPVVQFMGGVRLSDSDQVIANITFQLRFFGVLGLFALVPAAIGVLLTSRGGWNAMAPIGEQRPRGPLLWLAVASVVGWAFILPITQPAQQRRRVVEREFRAGRIAAGIEAMSAHPREAFPPHWDPPPRVGYEQQHPPLLDVMELLADGRGSDWVRAAYLDKVTRTYLERESYYVIREEEWARALPLIQRQPEGLALLNERRDHIRWPDYQPTTAPTTQASADPSPTVSGDRRD